MKLATINIWSFTNDRDQGESIHLEEIDRPIFPAPYKQLFRGCCSPEIIEPHPAPSYYTIIAGRKFVVNHLEDNRYAVTIPHSLMKKCEKRVVSYDWGKDTP